MKQKGGKSTTECGTGRFRVAQSHRLSSKVFRARLTDVKKITFLFKIVSPHKKH